MIEATAALRNTNPCGIIRSAPATLVPDHALAPQIKVPVLIVFGENDQLVTSRQGQEEEEGVFSGSPDKKTVFIRDAGHFVMFSRTAEVFDATLTEWLRSRFETP